MLILHQSFFFYSFIIVFIIFILLIIIQKHKIIQFFQFKKTSPISEHIYIYTFELFSFNKCIYLYLTNVLFQTIRLTLHRYLYIIFIANLLSKDVIDTTVVQH